MKLSTLFLAVLATIATLDSVDALSFKSIRKLKIARATKQKSSPGVQYYSYQTFKRLSLPALAYSGISNLATRLLQLQPKASPSIPPSGKNYNGRRPRRPVAIITGSNSGLGFETAKTLVQDYGYEVVMACRSMEKGVQACQEINRRNHNNGNNNNNQQNHCPSSSGGRAVFLQELDLSDLESVNRFADCIHQQYETIDVLINNAGRNSAGGGDNNNYDGSDPASTTTKTTSYPSPLPTMTNHGSLDILFTTNFLGHFLLTNKLLDKCRRIVNVSSVMHHFPKYSQKDDIESLDYWRNVAMAPAATVDTTTTTTPTPPIRRKTYGPSKLAALLFSIDLNRRYGPTKGIQSIAVNPGSVNSDIWRNYPRIMKMLHKLIYLSSRQGSSTSVAASVLDFSAITTTTIYLQPYLLPFHNNKKKKMAPPFPMFEMLGPYQGYVETQPRVPDDGGVAACQSL